MQDITLRLRVNKGQGSFKERLFDSSQDKVGCTIYLTSGYKSCPTNTVELEINGVKINVQVNKIHIVEKYGKRFLVTDELCVVLNKIILMIGHMEYELKDFSRLSKELSDLELEEESCSYLEWSEKEKINYYK